MSRPEDALLSDDPPEDSPETYEDAPEGVHKPSTEPDPEPPGWKKPWPMFFLGVGSCLAVLGFIYLMRAQPRTSSVTELYERIESGEVLSIYVEPRPDELLLVRLTMKENEASRDWYTWLFKAKNERHEYGVPASEYSKIMSLANAGEIQIESVGSLQLPLPTGNSPIVRFLGIAGLALVLLMIFGAYRLFSSGSSVFGAGPLKEFELDLTPADQCATFDDVAGHRYVKEELREIIEFLRDPTSFLEVGARMPRGALLIGPPGTGKTLLAKAVAGEANVPFFAVSGSDFVQMFVGIGATRVRQVFAKARARGPAIIYIDEIDAMAKARGARVGTPGDAEYEQTLNALLTEMDGFKGNDGIFWLASTNRADILDPAVRRKGRFDRSVDVGPPNQDEREAILKVHTRRLQLDEGVDLQTIARATMGFVGADLECLANEAALFARRAGRKIVTLEDLEDARDRAVSGVPSSLVLSEPGQRKSVAAHEAAHAVVIHCLAHEGLHEVHSATIVPSAGKLGQVHVLPRMELANVTRRSLIVEMAMVLAGRAGELQMDDNKDNLSVGASNDYERATRLAEFLVLSCGFGTKVGSRVLRREDLEGPYEEVNPVVQIGADLQRKVDEDIEELLATAQKLCDDTLNANREFHVALTERLERDDSVRGSELEAIRQSVADDS